MANAAEDTIEWVRKSVEWAESQFYATIGEIIALVVTILVAALAVGAAFRANRIARESAERQLRAYVNVASAKIFWLDNRRIRASVIVKNTGQTPARQMQQWMRSDIGNNVDFGPPPAPLDRHSVADLGSGLPMTYTVDLEPLDEPSWTNLRNRSTPFYVWGEISYQDIFAQNVRRTEFRLVLHPDNDTLAPHPEGNHST